MNPNLFTSRIYGYNTNNVNYQKQMKEEEMKNVVDKVLYEMNTQPSLQNSYYSAPNETIYDTPSKPNYRKIQPPSEKKIIQKQVQKPVQKNRNIPYPKIGVKSPQPNVQFTPEFYNVLKDMISKEVEKRELRRNNDTLKQILKKLQFYERKIDLLENEIVMLKKF